MPRRGGSWRSSGSQRPRTHGKHSERTYRAGQPSRCVVQRSPGPRKLRGARRNAGERGCWPVRCKGPSLPRAWAQEQHLTEATASFKAAAADRAHATVSDGGDGSLRFGMAPSALGEGACAASSQRLQPQVCRTASSACSVSPGRSEPFLSAKGESCLVESGPHTTKRRHTQQAAWAARPTPAHAAAAGPVTCGAGRPIPRGATADGPGRSLQQAGRMTPPQRPVARTGPALARRPAHAPPPRAWPPHRRRSHGRTRGDAPCRAR